MERSGAWWKRVIAAAAATAAVIGVLVLARLRPWADAPPPPPPPSADIHVLGAHPAAVAPGVYLLGRTSPGAAYAVTTTAGLVLIDSGLGADPEEITAQLAELRLDVKQLVAVLLTHVHADHSLGAARLRTLTGAKVYAGRADCPPLRAGGPREAFFSIYRMPDLVAHPTAVDGELGGDETLTFGDARVTAIATPGHTPGSVCYLLQRDTLRALFTGDVVQSLDPDTPGALGTYSAYLPPVFRGNARDYAASLRRLRALPPPNLVLPGHPRQDPYPQPPEVSPERWQALLDGGVREMERLQARYDADGADFLDGNPKELLPGLHYFGDHGGRAVYCLAAAGGVFLFDASGGESLVRFLSGRFEAVGRKGQKATAVFLTSADESATAGLAALVKDTGCRVVAPRAAHEAVRTRVPAGTVLLAEDELTMAGWPEVRMIPLAGRGVSPVAYRLSLEGKTVLVSGRIPVRASVESGQQLLRDVAAGNVKPYLDSLARLRDVSPGVWLPAVPVDGQNANLYDSDWARVLESNRRLLHE